MVILQEIDQREAELKGVETQAREATRTPIPQRRYGSGITKQDQQLAYARRSEGKKVLGKIQEQRGELKNLRGQVIAYNAQQAEIAALEKQKSDYEYGRRIAFNDASVFALTNETQRQGYRDALAQVDYFKKLSAYNQQIATLKSQGLTPIYDSKGNVIAFNDAVRMQSISIQAVPNLPPSDLSRYEKAGVLSQEPGALPPNSVVKNEFGGYSKTDTSGNIIPGSVPAPVMQSIAPPTPYESRFQKIEDAIKYPFNKAAEFYETIYTKAYPHGDFTKFTGLTGSIKTMSTPRSQNFGSRALRFGGKLASFSVFGAKELDVYFNDAEYRKQVQSLSLLQQGLLATNIVLSFYVAGSLTKSAFRYLKEPINIKTELGVPEEYFAETSVKNIRINDRTLNIASFEVTGISKELRAFEVPRYAAALRGLKPNDARLASLSFEELKLVAPEGQVKVIRNLRISKSITEPFIIQNGRILRATERPGEPGVFSFRGTFYRDRGNFRITSKKFSILSGETYESIPLRTLSKTRGELTPELRKALEEIEKINAPKGINAKFDFNKKLEIQTGGIRLEDFFKLTGKGFKEIPAGNRISRAEITALQKRLRSVKYETSNNAGLVEEEVLSEKIGAIDTSLPRIRSPKKGIKIEGIVFRKEYELPIESDVFYNTGGRKSSPKFLEELSSNNKQSEKALQEAIGNVALKLSKGSKAKINLPKAEVNLPKSEVASAFAGTGLYERTEATGFKLPSMVKEDIGLREAPDLIISVRNIPKVEIINKNVAKDISKEINKNVSKDVTKEILKEVPKLTEKNIAKSITKQAEKQVNKLIEKTIVKAPPRYAPPLTPKTPKIPKTPKRPPVIIPSLNFGKKNLSSVPGFKAFVIKGGKKKYLKGIFPEAEALEKGQNKTLKELRATFGVEKTGINVKPSDTKFKLSSKFRTFRIRKGEKIPLKNEFIQKRGTRLSSFGEVKEIQLARNLKL